MLMQSFIVCNPYNMCVYVSAEQKISIFIFNSFCESLCNMCVCFILRKKISIYLVAFANAYAILQYGEQSSVIFLFSTIHFIHIQIFNNCHRKFPKIPLDSISWPKDINSFHSYCKSLCNCTIRGVKLRGIFQLSKKYEFIP